MERPKFKVCIAAASAEAARAQRVALMVQDAGAHVTHPWWEQVLKVGAQNHNPDKLSCLDWALGDIHGVLTADVLLVLMPEEGASFGAGVEFGVAWSALIPIVVVGAGSIYCAVADSAQLTDAGGVEEALRLATLNLRPQAQN